MTNVCVFVCSVYR